MSLDDATTRRLCRELVRSIIDHDPQAGVVAFSLVDDFTLDRDVGAEDIAAIAGTLARWCAQLAEVTARVGNYDIDDVLDQLD